MYPLTVVKLLETRAKFPTFRLPPEVYDPLAILGVITNVYLPCAVPGPEPNESEAVQTLLPAEGAVIVKAIILGLPTPGAQFVQ